MKMVAILQMIGLTLTLAIGWSACGGGSHSPEEVVHSATQTESRKLTFETKEFRKESKGCRTDSTRCAAVLARYPVAVTGPEPLRRLVNDTIFRHVRAALSVFVTSDQEILPDLDLIAQRFIGDYEQYAREMGNEPVGWRVEVVGEMLFESPKFLSVKLDQFSYTGGAHPNGFQDLLVFALDDRRVLRLADLVSDEEGLKNLVQSEFRRFHQLEENADLNKEGFFWDDSFFLPENFAITEEGLYLFYNNYEVASYAVGPTRLVIPWNKLDKFIKRKYNPVKS